MTDDERAAREWLKTAACYMHQQDEIGARHRDTILRLLDRPVMPRGDDVPMPVLEKMSEAYWKVPTNDCGNDMRAAIDALHAHLTAPPKPKKVEAWCVIWPNGAILTYPSEDAARSFCPDDCRVIKLVEAADADQ